MEIGLYNHHPDPGITEEQLAAYGVLLKKALPLVLKEAPGPDPHLSSLDEVELSLVDDSTIARVHQDFMNIPGATDVITFHHGEILVSLDTARKQAAEYGERPERELFRYMVHGLLHLHGYMDYEPADREAMFTVQERLIAGLWPDSFP